MSPFDQYGQHWPNWLLVSRYIGEHHRRLVLSQYDACFYIATLNNGRPQMINVNPSALNRVLYNTSTLPEGTHHVQLVLGDPALLEIDYALITPGPSTNISNTVLYVDHKDPSIQFLGALQVSSDGNTRDSITQGDTIRFPFASPLGEWSSLLYCYFAMTSCFQRRVSLFLVVSIQNLSETLRSVSR